VAPLPIVAVRTAHSTTIGLLYFKTATHVVLLNHLLAGTDLGHLRRVVGSHYSHEADITIIPSAEVADIELIEAAE
jgi:hypothetical protein